MDWPRNARTRLVTPVHAGSVASDTVRPGWSWRSALANQGTDTASCVLANVTGTSTGTSGLFDCNLNPR